MYIYNDFLKMKTSELSDYSARGFALCYIETNDHLDIKDEHDDTVAYGLRLFFTRIFDPMMGSQSSRIAAYKMGFEYVGCELDADYFTKGCERFNRECKGIYVSPNGRRYRQLSLFELPSTSRFGEAKEAEEADKSKT